VSLPALDLSDFILAPFFFYVSPMQEKKKKALRNDETMFLALPLSIFDTSLIFY
jgi:hypothetical protein